MENKDYFRVRSTKKVEAIVYKNFYYNKFRLNKNSTNYKCREPNCHASLTIYHGSGEIKQPLILNLNGHLPYSSIEIDVRNAILEIMEKIGSNLKSGICMEQRFSSFCDSIHVFSIFTHQ